MAAGGTQAAFASQAATTANVTSGIRSAPSPDSYYTMRLSPSSVTVRAGYRTRITVSFHASQTPELPTEQDQTDEAAMQAKYVEHYPGVQAIIDESPQKTAVLSRGETFDAMQVHRRENVILGTMSGPASAVSILIPLYLNHLGYPVAAIGSMLAVAAVATLLSRIPVPKLYRPERSRA